MSHVAPHRWADALAGRLDDHELSAMNDHAASCKQCARAKRRVQCASDTFVAIKNAPPPELPWDSVRARIHWSVSTERHERIKSEPPRRRWLAPAMFAAAAAGALAWAFVAAPPPAYEVSVAPRIDQPATPTRTGTPPAPAAPTPLAGLVNRATGEVMLDGIRTPELFVRRLGAGTVIATGDGRVDVQFGDASAFAVGPRSMLELRRFDADAIELVVEGTVDIEVAPRATHQTFIVRAGDRVVEVRGTQFRVQHDKTKTTVACRHGLVAVRDAKGHVEVGAARRVDLAADHAVAPERMRPLSVDEVNDLAQATPMTLPMWNLDTLLQGSAPLEIATVGRRDVRVDGVELGLAPMRVRVLPGRHTVETADHAGRFRRAGWVDVAVPVAGSKPARLEVPAEPPQTRNISARRRQLTNGIDKARLAHCVRSIAKSGLTGTYVQIEIAVDAQGAVGFLNVIDTDLPSSTASCVREVLADVRFGAGDAATWRERIDL
ncbi:MAG: FecR family protein [Myxococcota bacterium]|nr:FecR family protein [Myxococcota bacterium]